MTRAARPTCMPTTTPGGELLSSWLQERPASDSGYSAVCQRTKVEAKLSPSSSSKTGGRRSYGKGLLGPRPATLLPDPTHRGRPGAHVPRDNMGTVLAIPMATEGLELDLREGLTQICVEKGTDSASQKQGPFKTGSRQLAVKEIEALDRPQLEWQLPRGLHRGDVERFGGEAEGSRGCRGNEMSWLAVLFARGQGLYRAGEAVAHCRPCWKRGWRPSPGWHPLLSRPAHGWNRPWQAPGWRRRAQKVPLPPASWSSGPAGFEKQRSLATSIPLPYYNHPPPPQSGHRAPARSSRREGSGGCRSQDEKG